MPLHTFTRRSTLALLGLGAATFPSITSAQSSNVQITMYKDPNCSCCGNWARHMQAAGFTITVQESANITSIKTQLGVPNDLASCHTATIESYVFEGHVPATAVRRLLAEKPAATGLAVPGMAAGAPGMDASIEAYDVILFGPAGRRTYARFVGDREV